MCAFRHGMIKDAHDALVDIQSSGRSKELLAQVGGWGVGVWGLVCGGWCVGVGVWGLVGGGWFVGVGGWGLVGGVDDRLLV